MEWRYLLWFWGLSMFSVVVVRTSYEPLSEYLLSLEPAHNLVFGYGKLTWDWHYGIRSYAYPCIIAIIYKILAILHLDYVNALIYAPRILQATISAIGYYYTCEVATIAYGHDVMYWTAAALSTNWFIFYCMSRTLYEGIETVCMVFALKYSAWSRRVDGDLTRLFMITSVGCIFRPSSAFLLWTITLFQYVWRLTYSKIAVVERRLIFRKFLLWGWIIPLGFQIIIDYYCYGTFWITPWEFFKLNQELNPYSHFDTDEAYNPFWYLVIGLPTALFTHLGVLIVAYIPFLIKKNSEGIGALFLWILVFYSVFTHKEISFLLPFVSLSCIIIGIHLKKMESAHGRCKTDNWKPKWIILFLFITNVPLAIFFSRQHKQGTLGAMEFLTQDKTPDNLMNITFLMPCYSMPAYSHLHRNVSLQLLSCEPNLHNISDYVDETNMFYNDPKKWISEHNLNASTHIVMFDTLKDVIGDFLQNFKLCAKIFHTNYPSNSRISSYVEIYCK